MKVLYIHQYFKTPADGGSLRSYYLAKALSENGVKVTMLTAHNGGSRVRKDIDGIDVIYLPVAYANEMSFSRRYLAFIKFMILAMIESCRYRKIDLCYIMTTPLTTGFVALFNKYLLGRPYIFEVGDLWPKVPVDMGLVRSKILKQGLQFFEKLFYAKAKGLVGLSEPISAHLKQFAPRVQTETIYNISDCASIKPLEKDQSIVSKYEIQNQIVISYTGTFGIANDLSRLIDMMEKIRELPVLLLMVGSGSERDKILHLVKTKNIENVRLYDQMDREEILDIFNISDMMFVSFADVPSLHTGSPNKLFDALAAGKPVITNFRGWVGELIESEGCGIVADSPEQFNEQLLELISDKGMLYNMGRRARALAEERFDLPIQAAKQFEFISKLST